MPIEHPSTARGAATRSLAPLHDLLGAVPIAQADWEARCADRLREEWPNVLPDDLSRTARSLGAQIQWRRYTPEVAVTAWLRLGLPMT